MQRLAGKHADEDHAAAWALGQDPDRRGLAGEDVAAPRSALIRIGTAVREIAERNGLDRSLAAHDGDGNVHVSFDVVDADPWPEADLRRALQAAADELVGDGLQARTVPGEHGIGVVERRGVAEELGGAVRPPDRSGAVTTCR